MQGLGKELWGGGEDWSGGEWPSQLDAAYCSRAGQPGAAPSALSGFWGLVRSLSVDPALLGLVSTATSASLLPSALG